MLLHPYTDRELLRFRKQLAYVGDTTSQDEHAERGKLGFRTVFQADIPNTVLGTIFDEKELVVCCINFKLHTCTATCNKQHILQYTYRLNCILTLD